MLYREDNQADAWHWRVHYTDGTYLDEYEGAGGRARVWAEVDMSSIAYLELLVQETALNKDKVRNFALVLPAGSRPIFFRRRVGSGGTDPHLARLTQLFVRPITCLGWQRTVEGRNVKSCTFLLEDGTTFVTDDVDTVTHDYSGGYAVKLTEA